MCDTPPSGYARGKRSRQVAHAEAVLAQDACCNVGALAALASRGHTRLSSLIIASTVQRVLLTAHCPVLVVRPMEQMAA
jgi:Universal stress protein family.